MINDNFLKLNVLYRVIGEINEIEACENNEDVKNHKSKLDAVLSCITDIDKREFSEEISNTIISNIKKALEDIYMNEMTQLHKQIGLDTKFEHCSVPKKTIDFEKTSEQMHHKKEEEKIAK